MNRPREVLLSLNEGNITYFCQGLCHHGEVCVKPELQLAVLPLSDTGAESLVKDECQETGDVMLLRVGLGLGGATSPCVLYVIMLCHLSLSPSLYLSFLSLSQLMRETEMLRFIPHLPLFFFFSSFPLPTVFSSVPRIDMSHKYLPLGVKICL